MTVDTHTLSGAYALDALEPGEVAAFEEHLAGCAACRQEVAEFRLVAAELAGAESFAPPPELRDRILAKAAHTRQLPPVVRDLPVRETGRPARRSTRWLVAAAAAVVLAVGGGVALNQSGDDGTYLAAGVSQVFEAPDAQVLNVDTANGGTLRIAMSRDLNEMAVDPHDLPDLGDQQVYQLWTIHDGAARSAGVLGSSGAAMPIPAGSQVAITIEQAPSATQPTREPIASLDPSSV